MCCYDDLNTTTNISQKVKYIKMLGIINKNYNYHIIISIS